MHDRRLAAAFTTLDAPWGVLHLAAADGGLLEVALRSETPAFVDTLASRLRGEVVPAEADVPAAWRSVLVAATGELAEYFGGRRDTFDVPLSLALCSEWDRRVLTEAAAIPFGQVASYGELARRLDKPRAARAVGGAMGRNPLPIFVPCHRVIAADGTIGGYGGGSPDSRDRMLAIKRHLLGIEGAWPPASAPPVQGRATGRIG